MIIRGVSDIISVKLLSIRGSSSGDEIYLSVEISDGEHVSRETHCVMLDSYGKLKLECGRITRETYEYILYLAELCDAVKKGSRMLAYSANSPRKLAFKLRAKGISAGSAEAAVEYLKANGYIDERSDVEALAKNGIRKLWGRRRIISYICSKGYTSEDAAAADAVLSRTDFVGNCVMLVEQSGGCEAVSDSVRRDKLVSSLMRKGYTLSEIKEAFRRVCGE